MAELMGWPFRDSPLKVPRRASGFRGPELVKAPSQPWLPVVEAGPELQSPPPDSLGDKRLYGVHPPPPFPEALHRLMRTRTRLFFFKQNPQHIPREI